MEEISLGALIIGYIFILPLVLIINVIRLHRRIDNIERYIGKKPLISSVEKEKSTETPMGKESLPEKKKVRVNWELEIGRKYYYWIGIFIFLIGFGLFLKYAFENKWFNETVRIIIGLVSGLILVFLGNKFSRYREFSLGLVGTGIVILYLSIFVANNFYHLIPYPVAFGNMLVVTVLGVMLTLRFDSMFLGILVFIGGFFTPLILKGPEIPLLQAFLGLSVYLTLLDAGIFAINAFKPWRVLLFLSFFFTYYMCGLWIDKFYQHIVFWPVVGVLSFFFFIYLFFPFSPLNKKHAIREIDLSLVFLNSSVFAGFILNLTGISFPDFKGFAALVLMFIHTLAGGILKKIKYKDQVLILLVLGLALVFLTLCFPLYLTHTYITIAWVCEGLILFWLGLRIPSFFMRIFGYLLFVASICRFFALDTTYRLIDIPVFNERFFTALGIVCCLFLASGLSLKRKEILKEEEKFLPVLISGVSHIILFVSLSFEFHDAMIKNNLLRTFSRTGLSMFWGLYGAILLSIGMIYKIKMVRYFALCYLGLAILKVLIFDLFFASKLYRIIVSLCTGIILFIVGYVYHRKKEIS
ncbi:MAG TPA: DUF2339 domain-containing protein [bacterium]|nr:DUF2339 domain-containing protein [bacterium]HOL34755.1 DUF2339 domain-containing protein [bacterium]HPP08479.1 DUF2339 domain-containing protein [bacterium]